MDIYILGFKSIVCYLWERRLFQNELFRRYDVRVAFFVCYDKGLFEDFYRSFEVSFKWVDKVFV